MTPLPNKINFKLDYHSPEPLYEQIIEQMRNLIVTKQLNVGDRLPSVRQLALILNINPSTAARAYIELEKEQIVVSRRGGGTLVTSGLEDPAMRVIRHKHLFDTVNEDIIKVLCQG